MKKFLSFGLALVLILSLASGMFAAVQTEENEDSDLSMWFDHPYMKVQPTSTASSGKDTYTIYMAQNEIEGCQFFLAPTADKTGLTASVSDFVNDSGDKLTPELFKEYYTSIGGGEKQPDQLVPYTGESFDISADHSQAFYIKVKTLADTKAGNYAATVTVRDNAGNEVKKAQVYLHIWKFALSEKTECKSAIYLDYNAIVHQHEGSGKTPDELYKIYYDYLLENRINAFNIPTPILSPADKFSEYLDNPRVNSFRVGDFSYNTSLPAASIKSVYKKLYMKNQAWLDKAYFYPVDEPTSVDALNKLKTEKEIIEANFPGGKVILPYHIDIMYSSDPPIDAVEFSKPYVDIWCPKTNAFTTHEEVATIPGANTLPGVLGKEYGEAIDAYFGELPGRMYAERDAGKDMWWYIASGPKYPYCNILIETEGISHRVLFWQQRMYDIEGFLYYYANAWFPGSYTSWDEASYFSQDPDTQKLVYGNGVLIWPGSVVGIDGPVGSFRIEGLRDGIEDFQILTMYQDLVGKEKTDEMIRRVTTSVAQYNSDGDNFLETRIALGNALERELTPPCADGEHRGGEATCIAKAVCEVCGYEYGELASHIGGEATCIAKAVCTVCEQEYGEFASHIGGEANCTEKAICTVCEQEYGEINPENHNFVDYICTRCGAEDPNNPTYTYGDLDGDGNINAKDSTLLKRFLAKWTVEINAKAADVDGNGAITAKDSTILSRYLAQWNVDSLIGQPGK